MGQHEYQPEGKRNVNSRMYIEMGQLGLSWPHRSPRIVKYCVNIPKDFDINAGVAAAEKSDVILNMVQWPTRSI